MGMYDENVRFSADVSGFNSAMVSAEKTASRAFSSINNAAAHYLGARGLIKTIGDASTTFAAFGQSVADLGAITELNARRIGRALRDLPNELGKVSRSIASTYEVVSSGFRNLGMKELIEFQKAISVSSRVIRADLFATGNAMTTIANAYQLNIDQVKKLQDWFYLVVREGKAQGEELARTLGLVISAASEGGATLNELGAAISILSRTQTTSQALIGLNQAMNAIIKPTLQAQAAARMYGIELSAERVQAEGLLPLLQELHDKVGGNAKALEDMFGNIRAGRAILTLTGKQFNNFRGTLAEFSKNDGSGMESFLKQTDTLQQAFENLGSQIEKTKITIGEDLEKPIRLLTSTVEDFLKAFDRGDGIFTYLGGRKAQAFQSSVNTFGRVVLYASAIRVAFNKLREHAKGVASAVKKTGENIANIGTKLDVIVGTQKQETNAVRETARAHERVNDLIAKRNADLLKSIALEKEFQLYDRPRLSIARRGASGSPYNSFAYRNSLWSLRNQNPNLYDIFDSAEQRYRDNRNRFATQVSGIAWGDVQLNKWYPRDARGRFTVPENAVNPVRTVPRLRGNIPQIGLGAVVSTSKEYIHEFNTAVKNGTSKLNSSVRSFVNNFGMRFRPKDEVLYQRAHDAHSGVSNAIMPVQPVANTPKATSAVSSGIGKIISALDVAVSWIARLSMYVMAAEFAFKIGNAIAERLKLKEVFEEVINPGGKANTSNATVGLKRDVAQSILGSDRALKLLDEVERDEFQTRLNLAASGEELEKVVQNLTDRLNELDNTVAKSESKQRSGTLLSPQEAKAFRAMFSSEAMSQVYTAVTPDLIQAIRNYMPNASEKDIKDEVGRLYRAGIYARPGQSFAYSARGTFNPNLKANALPVPITLKDTFGELSESAIRSVIEGTEVGKGFGIEGLIQAFDDSIKAYESQGRKGGMLNIAGSSYEYTQAQMMRQYLKTFLNNNVNRDKYVQRYRKSTVDTSDAITDLIVTANERRKVRDKKYSRFGASGDALQDIVRGNEYGRALEQEQFLKKRIDEIKADTLPSEIRKMQTQIERMPVSEARREQLKASLERQTQGVLEALANEYTAYNEEYIKAIDKTQEVRSKQVESMVRNISEQYAEQLRTGIRGDMGSTFSLLARAIHGSGTGEAAKEYTAMLKEALGLQRGNIETGVMSGKNTQADLGRFDILSAQYMVAAYKEQEKYLLNDIKNLESFGKTNTDHWKKLKNEYTVVTRNLYTSEQDLLKARVQYQKESTEAENKAVTSIMTSVQEFASGGTDKYGRLNSNALMHSMTLLARIAPSQFGGGYTGGFSAMGGLQGAQRAQNAVAVALDSFVVAQRHDNESIGRNVKTIADTLTRSDRRIVLNN